MRSQFGHLATCIHLRWLQRPAVMWSPFVTFKADYKQIPWGSRQKVTGRDHFTSHHSYRPVVIHQASTDVIN